MGEAWLNGFRLTQEKAYYVEMKDVLSTYGKWTKPWLSSFKESMNIIDWCGVEVDDDFLDSISLVLEATCTLSQLNFHDSIESEVVILLRTLDIDVS